MSTILKIHITNYDSTGTPSVTYRAAIVDDIATDISGGTAISSNQPGYEIMGPGTATSPANAVAQALSNGFSTTDLSSVGASGITQLVIETTDRGGNNGSGDFSIYHGTTYDNLYLDFYFAGMAFSQTGGTSRVVFNNLNQNGGPEIVVNPLINGSVNALAANIKGSATTKLEGTFMLYYENGDSHDIILFNTITNCFSSWTPIPKIVPVNSLQVGDLVRTNVGDQPISRILKSNHLTGVREYVIFEQNCFGHNLPSQSIYLTGCHPLSIGYFKVEDINDGKEDPEQDEKVFVHIAAKSLVDKLPGICKKVVEDNANYNLVFDQHCSIDIGGLDVITHHAVGNSKFPNPRLSEHQFQNPEKATKKGDKPFYIKYKDLLKYKPEDMDLKDFLGKCFVYDIDKKFNFGTIKADDNQFKDRFNY